MSAVGYLMLDVARQARAAGLSAALIAVSAATALACATARIEPASGGVQLAIGFGAVPIATGANAGDVVAQAQFWLAAVLADTIGVLIALIWTAGLLPSFLESHSVSVMLAKPSRRRTLFIARWLGIVLFVAAHAAFFIAATWLALGLRTGVWSPRYWMALPILVAHFSCFFAFSALLAVATRNATVCIVGSIVFWALCWAMNFGRHALVGGKMPEATAGLSRLVDVSYWLMPKPADFSLILVDAFSAEHLAPTWDVFRIVQQSGEFHPWASVLTSLAAGAAFLGLAAYEFSTHEY